MQTFSNQASFLDRNLQLSVLQLASWPALPDLLKETAPHVTRICALLARRPSVGMLIPVMLDMPPSTTYLLLETLYASGHIYTAPALSTEENVLPVSVQSDKPPAAAVSFLGKLWQRLTDGK